MQRSGGKSGRLILELPDSLTLAIPIWMLQPEAAQIQVSPTVYLCPSSLLKVIDLFNESCSSLKPILNASECHDGSTQF